MNYSEKLKDPRWQKLALKIKERDNFTCRECRDDERKDIEAHHRVYIKGLEPWEYGEEFLITLCNHCHGEWHDYIYKAEQSLIEIYRRYKPVDIYLMFNDLANCSEPEENGEIITIVRSGCRNEKFRQLVKQYARG